MHEDDEEDFIEKNEDFENYIEEQELSNIINSAFIDRLELREPTVVGEDLTELDWGEESHLWESSIMGGLVRNEHIIDNEDTLVLRKFGKKLKKNIINGNKRELAVKTPDWAEVGNLEVLGNYINRVEHSDILKLILKAKLWKRLMVEYTDTNIYKFEDTFGDNIINSWEEFKVKSNTDRVFLSRLGTKY